MGAVEEQARSDFPHRWTITNEAKAALLHIYSKTQYPSTDLRRLLADQLGVSSKQVQVWFRNQRQREKNPIWTHQMQASNRMLLAPQTSLHSTHGLNQASAGTHGQYLTEQQMIMSGGMYGQPCISMPNPGYFPVNIHHQQHAYEASSPWNCGHPHFPTSVLPDTLPASQLPASAGTPTPNMAQQHAMTQHAMMMSRQATGQPWPSPGLFLAGASVPHLAQQQQHLLQQYASQQLPQQRQMHQHHQQPPQQPGYPAAQHPYQPGWSNVHFSTGKQESMQDFRQQRWSTGPQEATSQGHSQVSSLPHPYTISPWPPSLGCATAACHGSSLGCDTSISTTTAAAGRQAGSVVEQERLI